jgi:sortase (surface protein transpeptidase)
VKRFWGVLTAALVAVLVIGGCGGHPVPIPPQLGPAIAPPVKPIDAIPKRIAIPSIGVDAAVIGIGLDNNQFELKPLDAKPQNVGWYIYGPPPGAPGPPALILSHINFDHVPGAFNHLDKAKVGDKITVARGDGPDLTFHVIKVQSWPKAKFSELHLYDPTPDAGLLLITCGGQYDAAHKNYLSNTIVRAVLDK